MKAADKQESLESSSSESLLSQSRDYNSMSDYETSSVKSEYKGDPQEVPMNLVKMEATTKSPVKPDLVVTSNSPLKHDPIASRSPLKQDHLPSRSPMRPEGLSRPGMRYDNYLGIHSQSAVKAEPEPSTSAGAGCLLTSSPLRGLDNSNSTVASSSCASSLSPVRGHPTLPHHTAASTRHCEEPSGSSSSSTGQLVESSVVDTSYMGEHRSHHPAHHRFHSPNHPHHPSIHNQVLTSSCAGSGSEAMEAPSCSGLGSVGTPLFSAVDSGEIDSTREEGELSSSMRSDSVTDSDMDTRVQSSHLDAVAGSSSQRTNRDGALSTEHNVDDSSACQSQSQGFEVMLDVVGDGEPSSHVDSSEGSIMKPRDRHLSAADSVGSSRSRHQSAADSVSEHVASQQQPHWQEEEGDVTRPDSRQEVLQASAGLADTASDGPQPSSFSQKEVEEGEVSDDNEEHVGSSGAPRPKPTEHELEEGEILDDSEDEVPSADSPSTSACSQPALAGSLQASTAARDDQAVSCSTDSHGPESLISSAEDVRQNQDSSSRDGEVVLSSSNDAQHPIHRSQSSSNISSSDHTHSPQTGMLENKSLPTSSGSSDLVGSSNRNSMYFLQSTSLAASSSAGLSSSSSAGDLTREGGNESEVDSTSGLSSSLHNHPDSRMLTSRSPADVTSSSGLGLDRDLGSRGGFNRTSMGGSFTSRWLNNSANTSHTTTSSASGESGGVAGSLHGIPEEEPSSSELRGHTSSSSTSHIEHASSASTASSSTNNISSTSPNLSPAPAAKKKVNIVATFNNFFSLYIIDPCRLLMEVSSVAFGKTYPNNSRFE